MTDVVVGEVDSGIPEALPARARVEGRRDPELHALLPERIVVVGAVEADRVVPDREARDIALAVGDRRHRPRDRAGEHRDLGAELTHAELELLDRLVRCVTRDGRGRRHAVAKLAEVVGGHDVERVAHGASRLVVGDAGDAEPGRGIDGREVDTQLLEPLVEEPREHPGRAVAGVSRRSRPEPFLADAAPSALVHGRRQVVFRRSLGREEGVGRLVAADLAHLLGEDRRKLDPVAVAVDDRVLELCMELGRAQMAVTAHVFLLRGGCRFLREGWAAPGIRVKRNAAYLSLLQFRIQQPHIGVLAKSPVRPCCRSLPAASLRPADLLPARGDWGYSPTV